MEALDGADALVIVTEWKEFRSPDFEAIKAGLKTPVIFDGRNLYDPATPRKAGLEYFAIGRFMNTVPDTFRHPHPDRRRRDAGPLLVRRGLAHFARSAGARGQGRAHRGTPGGAANVARNCAALGARVTLCFRWSAPTKPAAAGATDGRSGIECSLHEDAKLSTTVKLRVIGRQQQLLRIDFENAPDHEVLQAKLADFERGWPAATW
jgi:hypothetical protein